MSAALIQTAEVLANRTICREHFRLTLGMPTFRPARPGQFVHLSPVLDEAQDYRVHEQDISGTGFQPVPSPARCRCHSEPSAPAGGTRPTTGQPMLRRAFSIAALRPRAQGCEIDVIYRVVGVGTRWMASLKPGDRASVLGPRGNTFPIVEGKRIAWLVAGGVGLPPMLWLVEALEAAGKNVVFFYGAQTASLLALESSGSPSARVPLAACPPVPSPTARAGKLPVAPGLAEVVLATDDGSLGFHGHVGQALAAYNQANPPAPDDVVVYTCGPQRMMRFVADYCATRRMACFACMEQSMACGTGTCQSCVLPVRDASDPAGWRYALCCTEGPVFDALDVEWDFKVR